MAKKKAPTDGILLQLRAFGLACPGVHYKSPWPGHMDLAVKDKTFAYLSLEGEALGVGCKLPRSNAIALMLPFCKPTAYGLGKSGWVSASFEGMAPDAIDVDMLKAWIDESYRAQAPKKLVAQLTTPPKAAAPKAAVPKAAAPKAAAPKATASKSAAPKAAAPKKPAKPPARKPATSKR